MKYVYQQPGKPDRVVEFCCKDCINDFKKDPAKYLAKLDAAAPGASTANPSANGALLGRYIPVAEALAADRLADAKVAAGELAKDAEGANRTDLAAAARVVAKADTLEAARNGFKALSAAVEPLAHGTEGYVVLHCPMADADWVQTDAKVRNPYFGKMMLTCGEAKK